MRSRPIRRPNSAISAADQAREAYRPVFIISDFATDSEDWDYSLQARLEDALSEDRIYAPGERIGFDFDPDRALLFPTEG